MTEKAYLVALLCVAGCFFAAVFNAPSPIFDGFFDLGVVICLGALLTAVYRDLRG